MAFWHRLPYSLHKSALAHTARYLCETAVTLRVAGPLWSLCGLPNPHRRCLGIRNWSQPMGRCYSSLRKTWNFLTANEFEK